MAIPKERGALNYLRSTEPASWLAPSTSLAEISRAASQHLFSVLRPHAPKSPFDELLVNGFDAEQIWQQIDLQSQPLLSGLRRDIRKYEKNPGEIAKIGKFEKNPEEIEKIGKVVDDVDDMDVEDFYDDYEEDEVGEGEENEGGEETESDEGEQENGKGGGVVEDGFLKIKELEEFMVEDEAREYGLKTKKNKKNKRKKSDHDSDEEEEEQGKGENDDDDDEEELDFFGYGGDEDDGLDNARYEDFFGSKKKKVSKQNSKPIKGSEEDSDSDGGQDEEAIEVSEADSDSDDGQDEDEMNNNLSTHDGSKELLDSDNGQDKDKRNNNLSTHEKRIKKLRSEIEKNESANLEPKIWTMQGEVTATERPKNSALEVDLDFEHNLRPAPVITEEVTESIEEIIRKRILEERFDDVQKLPSSLVKAPRELKELDESKSKKGLAEVYENEFVRKTDPASAPLSFSDEQKNEAKTLFKKICLKLDALSHFHFAPKPVIEDMSIQANVPALAMEEIAPMAVSDAAMLAPEEVFGGKGNIKEEAELTQAERKRRRANKKRKFKSEEAKRTVKKPRERTLDNGMEEQ